MHKSKEDFILDVDLMIRYFKYERVRFKFESVDTVVCVPCGVINFNYLRYVLNKVF